jgi:hypothetical protein
MADQGDGQNARGRLATFKPPQTWDSSRPKFDDDDVDALIDYIDQVETIIEKSGITDGQQKKLKLTEFLPKRKRTIWRTFPSYADRAKTYEDFVEEIYKDYPEVRTERTGTLYELETLCKKNKGITQDEEGKLKRFGREFKQLIGKLSIPPAVVLNREACQRYMDTLEHSFAATLRTAVITHGLMKETAGQIAGQNANALAGAPAQGAVQTRKEDPISLEDLMQMAERMAASGIALSERDADEELPEIKRSEKFTLVKKERRDTRLDELEGSVAGLRDAMVVVQKKQKESHDELRGELKNSHSEIMKAFSNLKGSPSVPAPREAPPHMDHSRGPGDRGGGPGRYERGDRFNQGGARNGNCYYCEDPTHYTAGCDKKDAHIEKGWLAVENGKLRLGDGNPIPYGRGNQCQRVEEYWKRKNGVSQNFYGQPGYDSFYSEEDPQMTEMDMFRDEVKTLRVQLARTQRASQAPVLESSASVQPVFMAAAPTVQMGQPGVIPISNLQEEIQKGVQSYLARVNDSGASQEQFFATRSGNKGNASVGQGF